MQLAGKFQQLDEIVERIDIAQLAGVDQGHKQISYLSAVLGLVKTKSSCDVESLSSVLVHIDCCPAANLSGAETTSTPSSASACTRSPVPYRSWPQLSALQIVPAS